MSEEVIQELKEKYGYDFMTEEEQEAFVEKLLNQISEDNSKDNNSEQVEQIDRIDRIDQIDNHPRYM